MKLEVSLIKKEDLARLILDEADKEGWSYSEEDVDFYFNYECNQISAITVNGELAGCLIMHSSLSRVHNKKLCSAGLFFVMEQFRGKKLVGPKLWEQAFTAKIKEVFVCFNSVPRVVNFYERLGFRKTPLVTILYSLRLPLNSDQYEDTLLSTTHQDRLKIIDADHLIDIWAYMNELFPGHSGAGYRDFIYQWLRRPDTITIAYYDRDFVKGFGVLTVCKRIISNGETSLYYRLSPLYADTSEIACKILNYSVRLAGKNNSVKSINLNFLERPGSVFARQLQNIGFIVQGKNYVVSNYPDSLNSKIPVLQKIFASIPLEYPQEVVGGLD